MKKILLILTAIFVVHTQNALAQNVTITGDHAAGCSGVPVSIDVTVSNFIDITSAQFAVTWNPAVVEFVSVNNNMPPSAIFNTLNANTGELRFSWFDASPPAGYTPTGPPAGTQVIFTIDFNVVGGYSTDNFTNIVFGSVPGFPLEIANTFGVIPNGDIDLNPGSMTIQDLVAPTISCPADISVTAATGQNFAVVNYATPAGSDNCGPPAVLCNPASGSSFPVGTTPVTCTATDGAGNSTPCTFNVTVASAPPNPNALFVIAQDVDLDCNETAVHIPVTVINFDDMVSGQFALVWNESILDYINFTDNLNATGHPTALYNANNAGTGEFRFSWFDADGVPGEDLDDGDTLFILHFTLLNPLALPANVEITAVPTFPIEFANTSGIMGSSDYALENATVTITDNEPPTITCPSHQTVNANSTCKGVLGNYTSLATVSDNCSAPMDITVSQSPLPGVIISTTTTVFLAAEDEAGNSANCTFLVSIVDVTAPTVNCPGNQPLNANANCQASLPDFTGSANATDNCTTTPNISLSQMPTPGTFVSGTNTVTITAEDGAGNQGTCTFQVIVIDVTAPTITCPNPQTVNADANCNGSLDDYKSMAMLDDNCSDNANITVTQTPPQGTTISAMTTVSLAATDQAGNSASCTFQVSIVDVTPPAITCPADLAVDNDPDSCNAVVNWATPLATDNCDAAPAITCNPPSGSVFPVGDNTVMCIAEDVSGNRDTCEFTVTVNDVQAPVIACPADFAVGTDADECTATVTWADPTATDNCDSAPTITCVPPSGSVFPVGDSTVMCIAEDVSGNLDTCTFVVTVSDTGIPILTCQSDTTILVPAGTTDTMLTNLGLSVFGDNCGADTIYYVLTGATTGNGSGSVVMSGTSFNLDTTTVTFYVEDAAGNVDSCSFLVIIEEEVTLTLTCPANAVQATDPGECGAAVSGLSANADPPSALDELTWELTGATTGTGMGNLPDPTLFNQGTTTVTYYATSTTNFMTSCSFTVQVDDSEPPTFANCPTGNLVLPNTPDSCGLIFGGSLVPVATDNCPTVTTTYSVPPGSLIPVGGPTTITAMATDAAGNQTTCSYQLTVEDTQAPSIQNCPPNQVKNNAPGLCGANVTWPEPTATDNCGVIAFTPSHTSGSFFNVQTTPVEYVAVDAAGNVKKCMFTVKVNDIEPPSMAPCHPSMTVSNSPGQCSAQVTWDLPIPADNCNVVSFIGAGIPAGNVFAVGGPYPITYVATDAAGNVTSCAFNVTVNDTEFPQINNMPLNMTVPAAFNQCGAVINWTVPTATDNCGIQSFTGSNSPGEFFAVTPPGQPHVVTYTAIDINGNVTVKVFFVTVVDNQPPVAACPPDVTVQVDGNSNPNSVISSFQAVDCEHVQLTLNPLTATDNCGVAAISQTFGLPSGSNFPVGTNPLTFVVTDVNGGQSTCTFNVVVENLPQAQAQAFPDNPCEGEDVQFFVTNEVPGATYTWKNPAGTVVSNDPSFTLPAIAVGQAGNYTLDVALSFCQQASSASVAVFLNPDVEISHNDLLCTDGSMPLNLTATDNANAGVTQWQWDPPVGSIGFGPTFQVPNATAANAGLYFVFAETANGCTDFAFVDVPISNEPTMPSLFATNTAICQGTQVTLNGQQFSGSTVTYQWSAQPMQGSGLSANPPNNPILAVTPTAAGTYTYSYVVVVDGCASDMAQVQVEVQSAPAITVAIDGQTQCVDGTSPVTLIATTTPPAASYTWQGQASGPEFLIANANASNSGTYTVTASSSLGCSSTATQALSITQQPTTPAITPNQAELCLGASTVINSFPSYPLGSTFFWSTNGTALNMSQPSIPVSPNAVGTTNYTLQVQVGSCLSDTAFTSILTEQLEDVNITVSGEVNCLDGTTSVTLTANSAGATSYNWNNGMSDQQTLIISNATSANSGTYTVMTANGIGCESTGTYQLAITDALPEITALLTSPACEMGSLEFCAEPAIPGATYEWANLNGDVFASQRCPTIPNASVAMNGTYSVTASKANCKSSSSVDVALLMPPTANNEVVVGLVNQAQSFNVVVNDEIDGDYTITVVQQPEFGSVGYDGDGVFTYRPKSGFRETDRMAYEVCYKDCPDACDIAIVTLLIRYPGDQCVVTNVITPNNDGINDEFVISCLEVDDYPQNSLAIFNEWGDEVFDASPYQNNWTGTFNGKDLPDGTYFYVFKRSPDAPADKGFVMIHR